MASPEQNKQVIRQYFEAYDRQDTERIGQLVSSSNYTLHLSGMPSPMDWNGTKQFYAAIWSAFPDLHHDIFDMVAEEEEDKVAVRYNIIGTHKGELQGIPPTGKEVSFGAMDFITLIDGKVAEEWEIADTMGLMQQIGAIPSSEPPSTDDSSNSSNTASS
ncbi:MAG: ester cyclase [Thermoproteota archaeon]|nr:ester cyclase [Thermoproteota archaeon]